MTRFVGAANVADLESQNPAGLLVLPRGGRTFVVTFGHAWQLLDPEWVEQDFGRKVALNVIDPKSLIELRAEQVFAKWHLASDRAPRATSVEDFGVEFDRDLVSTVEGVPREKGLLGKTVRGGNNLRLTLSLLALGGVLDRAETWFKSTAYRKHWRDIDNLKPVRDQPVIDLLEIQLDRELASGLAQRTLVLFTPSHRRGDPLLIESYVFGSMAGSPASTPYLSVPSWMNYLDRKNVPVSVAEAKRTLIHMFEEGTGAEAKCHAFECFGYEMAYRKKQYVLSSGVWYQVDQDFLGRIHAAAAAIEQPPFMLPKWNGLDSEGEYNKKCCKDPAFLHFDAKNVRFGGGQSQFEFCDILQPKGKTLIFAKVASRSSGMSHLVEQVRRTSDLVFSPDDAFRLKLKEQFNKAYPRVDASWLDTRPRASDWKLCLISLGRSANSLPFFAKCSVVNLCRDMRQRGHDIFFSAV